MMQEEGGTTGEREGGGQGGREEIKAGKIRMDHFPILHVWQNP